MSIYQFTTGLKSITRAIFTKAFCGHDAKVISGAYAAIGMNLNEVFKIALQNQAYTIAKKVALSDQIDLSEAFKDAVQNKAYTIANSLLSLGQFNINYEGSEGASILKNIFNSNNNSLIKNYVNRAQADSSFKFTSQMIDISTLFEIAEYNSTGFKTISEAIAWWGKHNKLEKQSFMPKIDSLDAPNLDLPPPYSAQGNKGELYPILGDFVDSTS